MPGGKIFIYDSGTQVPSIVRVPQNFILYSGQVKAVEAGVIRRQLRETFGRLRIALIGNVVRTACKAVDGFYRLAKAFGQQPGRNREVFVVFDRH